MPTNAQYMTLVGDNRIVSLMNDDGVAPGAVAVPKTLENFLYAPAEPGDDQEGNRKIVIMMKVAPIWQEKKGPPPYAEDLLFRLKVRVPKGIITGPGPNTGNAVQLFTASDPAAAGDTPKLSYFPYAYALPQNETCYPEYLVAQPVDSDPPVSPDPVAQTVDIQIRQAGIDPNIMPPPIFANVLLFLVVVDWSYSASR